MKPARDLVEVLDRLEANLKNDPTPEALNVGEIVEAVGRRSFGPLLLIVGLFAISPITAIPGLTWASSLLILLIAGQMLFGMRRTWLPKFILNIEVPREKFLGFIDKVRPKAAKLEESHLLTTRLAWLSEPPLVSFVALAVIAAALVTIPLALVPLAPLAPGIAIVFFGIGMTARDGLWLLAGTAIFAGVLAFAAPLIF